MRIRSLAWATIVAASITLPPKAMSAQQGCDFETTRYITYETWSGDEIMSALRADGTFHHVTAGGEFDADVMRYVDGSGSQIEVRYSGGLFHHLRRSGGGPEASRFLTWARVRIEGEARRRTMRARYVPGRAGTDGTFCVEEVVGMAVPSNAP